MCRGAGVRGKGSGDRCVLSARSLVSSAFHGGAAEAPGQGTSEQLGGATDVVALGGPQLGDGGDEVASLLPIVAFELGQPLVMRFRS
jgi:hypothetical protein